MRTAFKVILIVVGSILLLAGLASTIGGGVLLAVDKGRDGYYETGTATVSGGGRALVADGLDLTDLPGWLEDRLGTVRLRAEADAGRPLFLGVGPAADVRRYLEGVAQDNVDEFKTDPARLTTDPVPGTRVPARPARQDFWSAQASGAGRQELVWKVEEGDWTFVLMNADGAPGVRATVSAGATAPFLHTLGAWLLGVGIAVLLIGLGLILWGALFRSRPKPPPAPGGEGIPVPPPAPPVP